MKILKHAACLLTLMLAATPGIADENSAAFIVSPKQCTSLQQGNICFVDLEVSWNMPIPAEYCLYADQQKLSCWSNTAAGQWQQALTMKDDMVISLRSDNQHPMYSQTIRYAWMYKKNNSNAMRWRLF